MKNFFVIMTIALFGFVILFIVLEESNANSESFEDNYFKAGYKEIYKALQESENNFKRSIALPTQLPPIPFTHSMGRFNDLEGNENDELEIFFINKDLPQNHYSIRIQPIKYRLNIKKEQVEQKIKLEDGSPSIFITTMIPGFNLLVFEKDGWQYILSIDKRNSNKVTKEILIDIANSIK